MEDLNGIRDGILLKSMMVMFLRQSQIQMMGMSAGFMAMNGQITMISGWSNWTKTGNCYGSIVSEGRPQSASGAFTVFIKMMIIIMCSQQTHNTLTRTFNAIFFQTVLSITLGSLRSKTAPFTYR